MDREEYCRSEGFASMFFCGWNVGEGSSATIGLES